MMLEGRKFSNRRKRSKWLALILSTTLILQVLPMPKATVFAAVQQADYNANTWESLASVQDKLYPAEQIEQQLLEGDTVQPITLETQGAVTPPSEISVPPLEENTPIDLLEDLSFSDQSGDIIVRFKDKTSFMKGMNALATGESAPSGELQLVQIDQGTDVQKVIADLNQDSRVEYAEPNYRMSAQWIEEEMFEPTDDKYSEQWALQSSQLDASYSWAASLNYLFETATQTDEDGIQSNIYDRNGNIDLDSDDDLQGILNNEATEIVVAVIDTGVDASHEDLTGRVLQGYNAITNTSDSSSPGVSRVSYDDSRNGHGTHVAGIIAANVHNDLSVSEDVYGKGIAGVTGVFPIQILPVKVLDSAGTGTIYDIAQGIEWSVDHGAKVINLSLGARLPDYPRTLADAIQYAVDHGVVVIAAAGNDGGSVEQFYPASLPGVVSVGASERNHQLASFSNQSATITAPGVDIWSDLPGDQYGQFSGTSQSAAYASGAAALYRSVYPDRSSEKVVNALIEGQRDYPEGCTYYWWGTICKSHYYVLNMPEMLDKDSLPWHDIELIDPAWGYGEVRLAGQSNTIIKVQNVTETKRVVLTLVHSNFDDDPILLGEVDVENGGIIPESGVYTFNWNTADYEDGSYILRATQYYEDDGYIYSYSDSRAIIIANDVTNGLTIQVDKPDGSSAAGAWVTVSHPVAQYDQAGNRVSIGYEEVWSGPADMQGKAVISGVEAVAENDFLVTARGSNPGFFYYQTVRAPGEIHFQADDAQEIMISGQRTDHEPLAGSLILFELQEGSLPIGGDSTQVIPFDYDVAAIPLATLNAEGEAQVYVSRGKYNMRLIDGIEAYYLVKGNLEVTDTTNAVNFHPEVSDVGTIRISSGDYSTTNFMFKDETDTFIGIQNVSGEQVVTVTPGEYAVEIDATRPDPDHNKEYVWTLDTPNFVVTAGSERLLNYGTPLSGTIENNPIMYWKEYWEKGSFAYFDVQFPDQYGNRTTSLSTRPLSSLGISSTASGESGTGSSIMIRSKMVQADAVSGTELKSQSEWMKTLVYNPDRYRFEVSDQALSAINPILQILDSEGNTVPGWTGIYLNWGYTYNYPNAFWEVPLNLQEGTYTAKASLAGGPLSESGVTESLSIPLEVKSNEQQTPSQPDVTVTILDRSGNPMSNAKVTLVEQDGGESYKQVPLGISYTNNSGVAVFDGLSIDPNVNYGVIIVGSSPNPARPLDPAETVMWFTPFTYSGSPVAITASAAEKSMHRAVLQPLDQDGVALTNMDYIVHGQDDNGTSYDQSFANSSSSELALWLPEGNYTFESYRYSDTDWWREGALHPLYFLTAHVSLPSGLPDNGIVSMGGTNLANLELAGPSSQEGNTDYYVPSLSLFPNHVYSSPLLFPQKVDNAYDVIAKEWVEVIKKRTIYITPGSYIAQAALVHRHFDGNWDYWLERSLTLVAGETLVWTMDDSFESSISTDMESYGASDRAIFTHHIQDSRGSRLVVAAIGLNLEDRFGGEGSSLPQNISVQNHFEVAPFLSIYNAVGTEVAHFKEAGTNFDIVTTLWNEWYDEDELNLVPLMNGGSTFFGVDYLIPEDSTSGLYKAKLTLGDGPHTFASSETSFSVHTGLGAPVLNALVSSTNASSVEISGSAQPGSKITILNRFNGEAAIEAGSATADDDSGQFSVEIQLPQEGSYILTATASANGMTSLESPPKHLIVDRTPSGPPLDLQGVSQDESHIRLTWQAPAGESAARYEIKRNGVVVGGFSGGQTLAYQDQGLTKDTEYNYEVAAIDSAGNKSQPAFVAVRTLVGLDSQKPTKPMNLQAQVDKNTIRLTWEAASDNIGVVGYKIYRSDAGNSPIGAVLATAELAFTDSALSFNQAYTYIITAYDAAGNESIKDDDTAATITATTTELRITGFLWQGGKGHNGLLIPRAALKFILIGDKNVQASAEVDYIVWNENGESAGSLQVVLTEDKDSLGNGLGIYRGTYTLQGGVTRLESITGVLGDGTGYSVERAATGFPLQLSGSFAVTINVDPASDSSSLEALNQGTLVAWSESLKSGGKVGITGPGSYTLIQLAPADDYVLRLLSNSGQLLNNQMNLSVTSGRSSEVSIMSELPAPLFIRIVDDLGAPAPNVGVVISTAVAAGTSFGYSGNNGWVARNYGNPTMDSVPFISSILTGTVVKISIEAPESYMKIDPIEMNLVAGENRLIITVPKRPIVTIEGTVITNNQAVLAGAIVTVYQPIDKRQVTRTTQTDQDGHYSLDVFAGEAQLIVSHRSTGSKQFLIEPLEANEHRQFNMDLKAQQAISLLVFTQRIGQPEFQMDMDWRVAVHLEMNIRNLGQPGKVKNTSINYFGDSFSKLTIPNAEPGDVIEVTADGQQAKMNTDTVRIELDENSWGKVEIHLKEQGIISGVVRDGHGQSHEGSDRWVEVYKAEQEIMEWVASFTSDSSTLLTANLKEGLYTLVYHWEKLPSSINQDGKWINPSRDYEDMLLYLGPKAVIKENIEVKNSVQTDLGPIILPSPELKSQGYFYGREGNDFTSSKYEAGPGSTITMRASYQYAGGQGSPKNLKFFLGIPERAELVAGSVVVKAAKGLTDPQMRVELGYIELIFGDAAESGIEGTILYKVKMGDHSDWPTAAAEAWADFTVDGKQKKEELGSVVLQVPYVTIHAPGTVWERQVPLSGRAPAGVNVQIYDSSYLLANTTASSNGGWKITAVLPDRGSKSYHALRAVVVSEDNGELISSPIAKVNYDPDQLRITNVQMSQTDGRVMNFAPGSAFPYVFVPGYNFNFDVSFNDSSRASNLKISAENGASAGGGNASPTATISTSLAGKRIIPGRLYASYDVLPKPWSRGVIEPLDENEVRSSMTDPWRDAVVNKLDYDDGDPSTEEAKAEILIGGDPRMKLYSTMVVQDLPHYIPSQGELNEVANGRPPAYEFKINYTEDDNNLEYSIKAIIPVEELNPGQIGIQGLETPAKLVFIFGKTAVDGGLAISDLYATLKGAFGYSDYADRLDALFQGGCSNNGSYRAEAEMLKSQAQRDLVLNSVIQLTFTGVGAFGGFGIGGAIGLAAANMIISSFIGINQEPRYQDLKRRMESDPDCEQEDNKTLLADVTWILDPSGVVYEAVLDNRLDGVTTTALYKEDEEWRTWDATWYEQQNPLTTDLQGRYGWDVPEGLWKVNFEKPGYETAVSQELEVPPPQTDVNIGMVSLAAPQVIDVRSSSSGFDITFDKYMLVTTLSAFSVKVSIPDQLDEFGEPVEIVGSIEPLNPQDDPIHMGVQLARTFRFTPNVPLTLGNQYSVWVGQMVQSYAERPMEEDYSQTVQAVTSVASEVSNVQVVAGDKQLKVTWNEPEDAIVSKIQISWRKQGVSSYGEPVEINKGNRMFTLFNLENGITYEIKIRLVTLSQEMSNGVMATGIPVGPGQPPQEPNPPSGDNSGGGGGGVLTNPSNEQKVAVGAGAQTLTIFDENLTLDIPEGAFPTGTTLVFRRIDDVDSPGAGMTLFSPVFEVSAGGIQPKKPIVLKMKVDPDLADLDWRKLGIYLKDGEWKYKGGITSPTSAEVVSSVNVLGTYAVMVYDHTFDDIVGHWSRDYVEVLISHDMVAGMNDKQFKPNQNITRGEIAKLWVELIHLASGSNPLEHVEKKSTFSDVAPDQWYFPYVQAAAAYGLVQGNNGQFRPKDPVTREEMSVMISNVLGLFQVETNPYQKLPFKDTYDISGWALNSVERTYQWGVMSGISADRFSPKTSATRAQAAVVLFQMMERLGLIIAPTTIKGIMNISNVEDRHFEIDSGQSVYVLLPVSEGLDTLLENAVGQVVEVTGSLETGPNSTMRGPVLQVFWINEKPKLAID